MVKEIVAYPYNKIITWMNLCNKRVHTAWLHVCEVLEQATLHLDVKSQNSGYLAVGEGEWLTEKGYDKMF